MFSLVNGIFFDMLHLPIDLVVVFIYMEVIFLDRNGIFVCMLVVLGYLVVIFYAILHLPLFLRPCRYWFWLYLLKVETVLHQFPAYFYRCWSNFVSFLFYRPSFSAYFASFISSRPSFLAYFVCCFLKISFRLF